MVEHHETKPNETVITSTICSSCRILYSTQSGRAKACARRTARILAEKYDAYAVLQNGAGNTVDQDESTTTTMCQSNSNPVFELARRLREAQTLLILFVSTTGDGEHTVRLLHGFFCFAPSKLLLAFARCSPE